MKPVVCTCAQLQYTGKGHDVCVAVTISFVSLEMCSFIATSRILTTGQCTLFLALYRPWNFKVCSWNVNGVRAWLKNNPMRYLEEESPDVICLQEVKCSEKDLPFDELEMPGYTSYWSSAVDKKGYSGTG